MSRCSIFNVINQEKKNLNKEDFIDVAATDIFFTLFHNLESKTGSFRIEYQAGKKLPFLWYHCNTSDNDDEDDIEWDEGGGDEDDDEEEEEGEHSCDIWVLNLGGIAAGRPGGSALAVDWSTALITMHSCAVYIDDYNALRCTDDNALC